MLTRIGFDQALEMFSTDDLAGLGLAADGVRRELHPEGIVTYQIGGRQFVAVASGSPSSFWVDQNPGSPTVFVFAIPAEAAR